MTLDDIFEGSDIVIPIRIRPVPADAIASWNFQFSLQSSFDDASPLIQKTTNAGLAVLDSSNAVVGISIAAADTDRVTGCGPGVYFWTLHRIDPGFVSVIERGKIRVRPSA